MEQYKVGEIAKMVDMNVETLRYYEKNKTNAETEKKRIPLSFVR
ncbi:MAG: MerR family transcriptional regulator [Ignavibacteriaceae bacterium]|nr:MerR family transcriptional regulator [Ignavibacteriaceae bacterium]